MVQVVTTEEVIEATHFTLFVLCETVAEGAGREGVEVKVDEVV